GAARQRGGRAGPRATRLAPARKLLRQRWARGGGPASAFAVLLAMHEARAALPPGLAKSAVQASVQLAAGKMVADIASPRVATLVQRGLQIMAAAKLKFIAGIILAAGLLTGVAGAISFRFVAAPPQPATHASIPGEHPPPARSPTFQASAKAAPSKTNGPVPVRGRVLAPDGNPLADAKLFLWHPTRNQASPPVRAMTAHGGQFE